MKKRRTTWYEKLGWTRGEPIRMTSDGDIVGEAWAKEIEMSDPFSSKKELRRARDEISSRLRAVADAIDGCRVPVMSVNAVARHKDAPRYSWEPFMGQTRTGDMIEMRFEMKDGDVVTVRVDTQRSRKKIAEDDMRLNRT